MKAFETAFEMQQAAPEAFDLSQEPSSIRDLYGLDRKTKGPGAISHGNAWWLGDWPSAEFGSSN